MLLLPNKFCSSLLAVYLCYFVIFPVFSPSGPIPFSFMEGQPGNLSRAQWGEIAMPDTFQALHRLCSPSLALFLISFSSCRLYPHILTAYPSFAAALTCTRAAKRRLTAADDFHDAPFFQLFPTLTHTQKWGTSTVTKKIFSTFSEWFANSARRLKWKSIHKSIVLVIYCHECKCHWLRLLFPISLSFHSGGLREEERGGRRIGTWRNWRRRCLWWEKQAFPVPWLI